METLGWGVGKPKHKGGDPMVAEMCLVLAIVGGTLWGVGLGLRDKVGERR